MVTAEHCFDDPGEYIVEFNVPLSGPGGELMPSEPEHRFEVDEGSIVHGSGIVGDDWAVFEVFETLGKTPLEKYGKYLTVAQMDLAEGAMIRITGYGRASGTLNKTQQSSADTYEGISGTTISFFTDVYQGVSGAPVIDDATGFVVGVEHTSGCPNLGTSTYNEDFWTAMGISAVTLDQRSEDDQRLLGTNIGRWQNTEFADIPIMETPSIINSTSGATEWLRGFQEIEDNEKYNRWNASSAVVNHHEFAMPSAPGLFVSWFKATHGGVTIKTDLLDAPGTTGGTIRFKDPWLIDSLDEELGNNPLNRGSAALFKTRPSPFYPNLSTPYNGDVYKGTFLFQSVGVGLPYYSVEAPEVNYLGVQNIESYFKMWSASNQDAIIPDASENITGVEFRSENATIRALYKGASPLIFSGCSRSQLHSSVGS